MGGFYGWVDGVGWLCKLCTLHMKRHVIVSGMLGLGLWLLTLGMGQAHGDLHERIAGLSARIAAEPGNAGLYLQRAEVYRQHEEWGLALADCDRARREDGAMETGLLRGQILLGAGRAEEALPVIEGYLMRHPGEAQALVCRARILVKTGRQAAAVADYRKALQGTPAAEPDLVQEVADALAADGKVAEAVEVLGAGIARLGAVPSLVLRAMDWEIATKDYDAALRRVEVMRRSAPRPEPWMAKRASILAQAGRVVEARAAWRELAAHLAALPNLERGSHAMSKLMEETRQALASLESMEATQPVTGLNPTSSVP